MAKHSIDEIWIWGWYQVKDQVKGQARDQVWIQVRNQVEDDLEW